MRRYRFLVDPAPSAANPDQLPIGFTRHFDPGIGEDVLDITCAACHTGEIHYTKDGKTQRHPHRRRPGHACVHRHVARQLRADAGGVAASAPRSTRGSSTASRRRCWAPAIRDAKPQLRKALRATI